jgi:DNA-directed RNA polymerase
LSSSSLLALQVYRALNVLGNLGWCINTPVLAVAEAAWARGGDFAGLPSRIVQPSVPPPALPYRFRIAANPQPFRQRQANQLTAQVWAAVASSIFSCKYKAYVVTHILHGRWS